MVEVNPVGIANKGEMSVFVSVQYLEQCVIIEVPPAGTTFYRSFRGQYIPV